jgi:hypothetical protein
MRIFLTYQVRRLGEQLFIASSKLSFLFILCLTVTLLATTSCDSSSTQANRLSSFSDWRAAYLDKENKIHAITLDGKKDITGLTLSHFSEDGLAFSSSLIGPDGHTLAYAASSLGIVDLAGKSASRYYPRVASIYDLEWFHDGSKAVATNATGSFWIIDVNGGDPAIVPSGPFTTRTILDGWIDATHLAVSGYSPQSTSDVTGSVTFYIDSLDITTGKLHSVAAITAPSLGVADVVLSSDGSKAIFDNTHYRDDPFTPLVAEIDMQTGKITNLSNITRTTGASLTSLAWKPGTQTIAASTGFFVNGNLKTWLLDLQNDTVTHIFDGQYVEQWSPDNTTLVVSTGKDAIIGRGPYTISAVTFAVDGHPTVTQLTTQAMSSPFIGFVRTAA